MIDWLLANYIEILGVVSGLLFLYFEYKEDARLWPLGILTSAFYIVIFFQAKFYADMGLQVYYLFISMYGWYAWLKASDKNGGSAIAIKAVKPVLLIRLLLISTGLWVVLYFVLSRYTDSPVPVGDSFTSSFAVVATWMLSRKILEQWHFWIVINTVACGLYFYRGLNLTAMLFIVYSLISVAGYFEWKRKFKLQTT